VIRQSSHVAPRVACRSPSHLLTGDERPPLERPVHR
jgi:hypothetical protein